MTGDDVRVAEHGLLSMSKDAWAQARRRARVIGALAEAGSVSSRAADRAGQELGLSRRRVYELVRRRRQGTGLVTDLAPGRSDGGRGGVRLSEPVETVIRERGRSVYLSRQRPTLAVLHRDIARACKTKGLAVPARNTVAQRISVLHPAQAKQSREGADATRSLRAAGDTPPPVSVGLCLAQACCDKRHWLESLGVEVDWPMSGKPHRLYLDNASEFKSKALRRGCEQHGFELSYRPGVQPHYGGIVERVIGTAMAHKGSPGDPAHSRCSP